MDEYVGVGSDGVLWRIFPGLETLLVQEEVSLQPRRRSYLYFTNRELVMQQISE